MEWRLTLSPDPWSQTQLLQQISWIQMGPQAKGHALDLFCSQRAQAPIRCCLLVDCCWQAVQCQTSGQSQKVHSHSHHWCSMHHPHKGHVRNAYLANLMSFSLSRWLSSLACLVRASSHLVTPLFWRLIPWRHLILIISLWNIVLTGVSTSRSRAEAIGPLTRPEVLDAYTDDSKLDIEVANGVYSWTWTFHSDKRTITACCSRK